MNNIILIGLRGSGKSLIGKTIAQELGYKFIDTDEEIEKKAGQKIKEIVENNGWEYFRKLEKEIIQNLKTADKSVISTGGGSILDKDNQKNLQSLGKIIYLHRSPEKCAEYIENDTNRPALTEAQNLKNEMKQLYKERNESYSICANLTFERTDNEKNDSRKIIEKICSN